MHNDFRTQVVDTLRTHQPGLFQIPPDVGDAELLHILKALIDDRASVDRMLSAVWNDLQWKDD
jgi:hypothetical protein